MIVICTSCMTKFSLDDSRIPAKGARVRCSKCQHVFFVVPPTEPPTEPRGEEPMEDFESFIKSQKEFAEPGPKRPKVPPSKMDKREDIGLPEEEEPFFGEEAPARKVAPFEPEREERAEAKPVRPKRMVRRKKRRPPVVFFLIIFLVLLVLGGFYLWTEYGSKVTVTTYLEYSTQKAIALWDQVLEILGVKQQDFVWGGLTLYDEKVGDFSLSVIEGKVKNQSQFARRHIKIRVEVFDEHNNKIAEKETFCGLNIGLDGLKSLPPEFFKGEMLIQPQQPKDMVVPTGKEVPFMVVFKDLISGKKKFEPKIAEAPNL